MGLPDDLAFLDATAQAELVRNKEVVIDPMPEPEYNDRTLG